MRRKRPSVRAALGRGWLAAPLLLAALVSPPVEAVAAQSLVVHHLAHWSMVAAGALAGYQLRDVLSQLRARTAIAVLGLAAALAWHVPPLLSWAEADPLKHAFAHGSLIAGGVALGWAVPAQKDAARAFLFIGANVVMWPLVLAELAGVFRYRDYPGQEAAAGLAELGAMSLSWFVVFAWSPIRAAFASPIATVVGQALFAVCAVAGWASRIAIG